MAQSRIIAIVVAVVAIVALVVLFWPAGVDERQGPLPVEPTMPDEAANIDTDPQIEPNDVDADPVGAQLQEDPYGPE